MKNSLFLALASVLLFFASCNSIDQEVVDNLQGSLTKLQENQNAIDGATQNVANLLEQMNNAPAGLKASEKFGYSELLSRVDAISQGLANLESSRAELQKKVDAALADYTDGKIDKEAALKEEKAVQEFVAGAQGRIERVAPMFDELSAEYAKMSATWMSLPEAERQALSAPQPGSAQPGSAQPGAFQLAPSPSTAPSAPENVKPQTGNSLVKPQGSNRE